MAADKTTLISPPFVAATTHAALWPITLRVSGSEYSPSPLRHNYRGVGYIAGTVTHDGAVAARNVFLFHRATGALVAKTVSASDGTYRFDGLSASETFLVVATDADVNEFNAACADIITPAT